jgi:DNA-binding NarL/FixJ family response regulator
LKHSAPKELVLAIRADRLRKGVTALTPGQQEVLQLRAEGKPAREIGDVLGVSTPTVEFHEYEMMQTLGIQNSAELIHFAIKQGFVQI